MPCPQSRSAPVWHCHFPAADGVTLPQGTWMWGFPMLWKGCGIKYSPLSSTFSPLCRKEEESPLRESEFRKCSQDKTPSQRPKPQTKWAGGDWRVQSRRGWSSEPAGWTDTQTGLARAWVCPPVLSCAGFPLWVLSAAIALLPPFHTPRCFPEVTNSHSFSWLGPEPRGEMLLPLKMRSQRAAVEEKPNFLL